MLNRRRMILGVAAFAVVALAVHPAPVQADHSWNGYHWARTSNPFTLKLGDNVSSTWDPFLDEAASDWSASSVLDLVVVAGGTRPKACRPTSGRVEVCAAKYGNNGWLGIAQIWVTGGVHITQGLAKMNDTYFNTPSYDTPAWRRLVMCQEIAHAFGLDHQDENFNNANLGSCMDYTSNPEGPPSNEHPNAHDFEQLEAIYAHLDDFTTLSFAPAGGPAAMGQIDFSGPGQWGQLVALSRDGGQAVYVLDFGGGHQVVTFVTWTKEVARELARVRDRLLRSR